MSEINSPEAFSDNFFLSFASAGDMIHVQMKKELLQCLEFLTKILNPSSLPIVTLDFSSTSHLTFLEHCFRLSENVKAVILLGHKKKTFPILVPESLGSQTMDISVVSKLTGKDVLGLLLECDKSGVYLNGKESKSLFSLIIGSLRDSAVTAIHNSCRTLQEKTYKKQKKIKKVQARLDSARSKLNSFKNTTDSLQSELTEYKSQFEVYESQLIQVKGSYSAQQTLNISLQSQLFELRELIRKSLNQGNHGINLHLSPSLLPEDRLIL